MDWDELERFGEQRLESLEMGNGRSTLTCTHGKIVTWFGRKADDNLVKKILFEIAGVDPSINHELEVTCEFKAIQDYENKGLILVSYARADDAYRAMFNVPFSNENALNSFAEHILNDLKETYVSHNLLWDGNDAKIRHLSRELRTIDGWSLTNLELKEDVES